MGCNCGGNTPMVFEVVKKDGSVSGPFLTEVEARIVMRSNEGSYFRQVPAK